MKLPAARRRERAMPEHILSLSYGKDSLACLGAIKHLGWPLDRIVTADLWATPTIPADPPLMVEFKSHADEIIWQKYGIRVEHYTTKHAEGITGERVSYEECFYRKMTAGKFVGSIKGFPMQKRKLVYQAKTKCHLANGCGHKGVRSVSRHSGR